MSTLEHTTAAGELQASSALTFLISIAIPKSVYMHGSFIIHPSTHPKSRARVFHVEITIIHNV